MFQFVIPRGEKKDIKTEIKQEVVQIKQVNREYRNYLNFSSVVEKSEWATVWLRGPPLGSVSRHHGRIIYKEEKAKGQRLHPGGTELLQFLAPLAILHWDDLKNMM